MKTAEEVFGTKAKPAKQESALGQEPIVDGAEENEYMVPSESRKDFFYTVRTDGSKVLSCDCQGYATNKKCKHENRVVIEKIL